MAWHSQVTWQEGVASGLGDDASSCVCDLDVNRPPREVESYTASVLWSMLGQADDTAGLQPQGDALPIAKYYGTLQATDSHSVNKLLNKYLDTVLKPNEFHLASYCVQHMTGSTAEACPVSSLSPCLSITMIIAVAQTIITTIIVCASGSVRRTLCRTDRGYHRRHRHHPHHHRHHRHQRQLRQCRNNGAL